LRITILGSGTSHGVPVIGCDCAVCRSTDPRDRRTRPSVLIDLADGGPATPDGGDRLETIETRAPSAALVRYVLVDTSTDLRAQALAHDIRRVDAILFTHSHADHVMGLDEVRRFNELQSGPVACYGDDRTLAELRRIFAYIFDPPSVGGGVPQLSLFRIAGPFWLGGAEIVPIPLLHGPRPILGFRIGAFAYLTDCNRIPDQSWALLAGVRVLVLDALRHRPHSTHFTVDEALEVVSRLGPARAYFTHIAHDLPHGATCARLPAGVQLAYDGLVLEV
jgi:phosphoribosyl 1,2-cyclic phosphate phosphodiesterase